MRALLRVIFGHQPIFEKFQDSDLNQAASSDRSEKSQAGKGSPKMAQLRGNSNPDLSHVLSLAHAHAHAHAHACVPSASRQGLEGQEEPEVKKYKEEVAQGFTRSFKTKNNLLLFQINS